MNAQFLLCIFALSISTTCWPKSFVIQSSKFSLDVPKEWKDTKDLFGMPLTLSGPMKGDARPIITVTPTEMKRVKFNQLDQNSIHADYRKEREEWLVKHKGEFISLTPYKKEIKRGIESHSIGYSYVVNKIAFIEKTYYVICNEQLYHLKYLLKETQREAISETEKIVESFRCTK